MNAPAIEVVHLGKRYQLGEREQYLALRDLLADVPSRLVGRIKRSDDESSRARAHTWAPVSYTHLTLPTIYSV